VTLPPPATARFRWGDVAVKPWSAGRANSGVPAGLDGVAVNGVSRPPSATGRGIQFKVTGLRPETEILTVSAVPVSAKSSSSSGTQGVAAVWLLTIDVEGS
jgi:hypothetical protein